MTCQNDPKFEEICITTGAKFGPHLVQFAPLVAGEDIDVAAGLLAFEDDSGFAISFVDGTPQLALDNVAKTATITLFSADTALFPTGPLRGHLIIYDVLSEPQKPLIFSVSASAL